MMNPLHYKVYQRINEVPRILGLPLDELLPAVGILALFYFKGNLVMGFAFAAVFFFLIRHFKEGQGKGWLLSIAYWYLPHDLFSWQKVMPASYKRFWL